MGTSCDVQVFENGHKIYRAFQYMDGHPCHVGVYIAEILAKCNFLNQLPLVEYKQLPMINKHFGKLQDFINEYEPNQEFVETEGLDDSEYRGYQDYTYNIYFETSPNPHISDKITSIKVYDYKELGFVSSKAELALNELYRYSMGWSLDDECYLQKIAEIQNQVASNNTSNKTTNTQKKQLPTGIQTFADIRNGDYYYVDKTLYLLELAKERAVFLSRPRRFGKSLTIDTLDELFSGNKALFTGLYAEDNWDWETKYPVIRLGFTEGQISSADMLTKEIHKQLASHEKKYQLATGDSTMVHDRFRTLIENLAEAHNKKAVLLIDEYDKPMLDNINKPHILAIRDVLRNLYSVIKGQDAHLRFSMLTGVSKFSKVNIFSGLNSPTDITLDEQYSAICGYTQAELEDVFAPELTDVDNDKMEQIQKWYNGYNWTGESVYNPYDILLFLQKKKRFQPYWFQTGSSAWLVDNLATNQLNMHEIEDNTYNEMDLSKFDIGEMNPIAILFQAGYLTINKVKNRAMGTRYTLKYPNIEVQQSLNEVLLNKYLGHNYNIANEQDKLYDYLLDEDYEKVKTLLYSFYASIPYQWYTDNNNKIAHYEGHYASVFYSFLTGLGSRVYCEDSTNQGRMDAWFDFEQIIYIIEFKVADSEQEVKDKGIKAIEQIKEKNYADKFTAQQAERGKPIVLMGVVFGREERNIVGFEVETLDTISC